MFILVYMIQLIKMLAFKINQFTVQGLSNYTQPWTLVEDIYNATYNQLTNSA